MKGLRFPALLFALILGPSPAAQEPPPVAPKLLRQARQTLGLVARLRGRPFLREVHFAACTVGQLRQRLERRLLERRGAAWFADRGKVLVQLGLLPPGTDYLKARVDFRAAHSGGIYRPRLDGLYVVPERCRGVLGVTLLAGQLTLALDDHHHNLGRRLAGIEGSDRQLAVAGLVRGSARTVEVRTLFHLRQAGLLEPAEITRQAAREQGEIRRIFARPPVLVAELYAPGVLGVGFLAEGELGRALKGLGERVDRAARDLPRSSEQILHPEKYWDPEHRDEPVEITLPSGRALLGAGWHLVHDDTLGEIQCANLARPEGFRYPAHRAGMVTAPGLWTHPAATGWGGDRVGLYRGPQEEEVLVWATAWDREADAKEFFTAFHTQRRKRLSAARREGRLLVLVCGSPPARGLTLASRAIRLCSCRQGRPWRPGGPSRK